MMRPGFSLIELMIYLTLLGLIGIGVATAYNFFLQSSIEARSIAELRQDSTTSLDPVRAALSKADSVAIVDGSDSQQCAIATTRQSVSRTGLDFSSSEKLALASFTGIGGADARSIGFWVVQPASASAQTIVNFGDASNGAQWRIFSTASTGTITVDINGKSIRGSTDIADGNWNHVMVTFDGSVSDNFSASTLAIYVNGIPETLTESSSATLAVNTDNASTGVTIGGGASDTSFVGQLASIKLWQRALSAGEIWPEVLSSNAASRDDLMLEMVLASSTDDTSDNSHSVTAFASPEYVTLDRSYASKTTYAFADSSASAGLSRLWSMTYMDATAAETIDRCFAPTTASGWAETSDNDWLLTADDPFAQDDGVVTINAEIATEIGGQTLSVGNNNFVLAGSGVQSSELCKIAPNMAGFDTGGNSITEAVVRIDDGHFEADKDELYFFEATKTGPTTVAINDDNKTFYTFKDIKANGSTIWSNITAEYEPATGVMRICTSTGDNCTAPDLATAHSLDDWQKVFREITYKASSQTYKDEKAFLFTLGGAIPCRMNNYLACRNINNDDFDDDISTCYHYFDFIFYDDLGASYACHATEGIDSSAYSQCLADWEDARDEAETSARELFDLQGYLATVTSAEENTCASTKIAGAWGWMGASDRTCERDNSCGDATSNTADTAGPYGKYNSKDTPGEGYWYWVTGPEGEWSSSASGYQDHDGGSGQGLYIGNGTGSGFTTFDHPDLTDHEIPAAFTNWGTNQPNDWVKEGGFPTQDYLQTYLAGKWNDDTSYDPSDGFLIEYGGISTDDRRVLTKRTVIDTFAFLKKCK